MHLRTLLRRNLRFHRRGNLAVLLGVAVGTAVLTGALLVGDSLRGSLRDLTLERLGPVDHALVAARFVRAGLAVELGPTVRPALLLQGAAGKLAPGADAAVPVKRAGRITVLGVDHRFWPAGQVPVSQEFWDSADAGAVLNAALADELGVKAGDPLLLYVQKASAVPRETLLGRRESGDVLDAVRVTVRAVLPDEGLALFSLTPTPAAPRNAFVPLGLLQAK